MTRKRRAIDSDDDDKSSSLSSPPRLKKISCLASGVIHDVTLIVQSTLAADATIPIEEHTETGGMNNLYGRVQSWRKNVSEELEQPLGSPWKNFETEICSNPQRLERRKLACPVRTFPPQKRVQELEKYHRDIESLKRNINSFMEEEQKKKGGETKEWLAIAAFANNIHEGCLDVREKYSETGKWILDHDCIKSWMLERVPVSPVVWLHGIHGAGKTVLASLLIEECLQKKLITSYMYCSDDGSDGNTAVGIIRALINQLACHHEDLIPYFHSKRAHSGESVLHSFQVAKDLWNDACARVPKCQYIIVDGLDRCEPAERKLFLETIISMVNMSQASSPGKLRLLVISQYQADIMESLKSQANPTLKSHPVVNPAVITLSPSDTENDIRTVVSQRAREIQEKFNLGEEEVGGLEQTIMAHANGSFLFVERVMSNFLEMTTREDLFHEIKKECPEWLGDMHKGSELAVLNKSWTCVTCNESFNNQSPVTHMNSHKPGPRPFTCRTCSGTFKRETDYTRHQKVHVPHHISITQSVACFKPNF